MKFVMQTIGPTVQLYIPTSGYTTPKSIVTICMQYRKFESLQA
jgi:hypothetical protein